MEQNKLYHTKIDLHTKTLVLEKVKNLKTNKNKNPKIKLKNILIFPKAQTWEKSQFSWAILHIKNFLIILKLA